jgi:hypothetical protein
LIEFEIAEQQILEIAEQQILEIAFLLSWDTSRQDQSLINAPFRGRLHEIGERDLPRSCYLHAEGYEISRDFERGSTFQRGCGKFLQALSVQGLIFCRKLRWVANLGDSMGTWQNQSPNLEYPWWCYC